jgi:uncharacterized protein
LGQRLSRPRPASIREVVRDLTQVQMDPTSVVARTEHLVLFSRLGRRFDLAELERLLWRDRALFEYWVHIVPIEDLPIHRRTMRRYPDGPRGHLKSRQRVREFLAANEGFRRYVLRELRRRGPLRARELEDRAELHWRSGGWDDERGRSVAMLLDLMWNRGEVMIVGRDGQQRLWGPGDTSLPMVRMAGEAEAARVLVEGQVRAQGVARRDRVGMAFDGPAPGRDRALQRLEREGTIVPVRVEGLSGGRLVHAELLERAWRPRTVLLSPFDDLVSDRDRAEALFGFRFRLEIYVPPAQRRWGYFVLPILHGDRLIGRVDPRFDRETGALVLTAVFAEDDAPASAGPAARRAIDELAGWLGAREVRFTDRRRVPAAWRAALGA